MRNVIQAAKNGMKWKRRVLSSMMFIMAMTIRDFCVPRRFSTRKKPVTKTAIRGIGGSPSWLGATDGQSSCTVSAKMSTYMAAASTLPIQKNQPVKKAMALGSVRLTKV